VQSMQLAGKNLEFYGIVSGADETAVKQLTRKPT